MHSAKSEGDGKGRKIARVSSREAGWETPGRAAARATVNVAGKRDVGTSR